MSQYDTHCIEKYEDQGAPMEWKYGEEENIETYSEEL